MKISKDILKAYAPEILTVGSIAATIFTVSNTFKKRYYKALSKYWPIEAKLLERMHQNNYRRMHGLPLKRKTLKKRRFGK